MVCLEREQDSTAAAKLAAYVTGTSVGTRPGLIQWDSRGSRCTRYGIVDGEKGKAEQPASETARSLKFARRPGVSGLFLVCVLFPFFRLGSFLFRLVLPQRATNPSQKATRMCARANGQEKGISRDFEQVRPETQDQRFSGCVQL